ncbi:MAG: DUF6231 family protein [Moraxellaceae bacterium]
MTKQTASRSEITLPLLIDYTDVLFPSLTKQTDVTAEARASTTTDNPNDIAKTKVLWVVQDNETLLALDTQLKNQQTSKENEANAAVVPKFDVSTISDLMQQQVPDRYELVCFWLPTLPTELLQQYIPVLMRYRDLYAAHLLIALQSSINLKAYGFTPFDILSEQALDIDRIDIDHLTENTSLSEDLSSTSATLWQFNLYDYKQLPNWLNADYWANPENWGKHRW